jgi:hypothetical protein
MWLASRAFVPKVKRLVFVAVFLVQFVDLRGLMEATRARWTAMDFVGLVTDKPEWSGLSRGHAHLVVNPPWQCDIINTPGGVKGFWIFGKLAVRERMSINSFYAGRTSDEQKAYFCDRQPADILKNGFDENTTYVFSSA